MLSFWSSEDGVFCRSWHSNFGVAAAGLRYLFPKFCYNVAYSWIDADREHVATHIRRNVLIVRTNKSFPNFPQVLHACAPNFGNRMGPPSYGRVELPFRRSYPEHPMCPQPSLPAPQSWVGPRPAVAWLLVVRLIIFSPITVLKTVLEF